MQSFDTKKWTSSAGFILLLGVIWIGISTRLPGSDSNPGISVPQAGFIAPDFTLLTMEGETVILSEMRGQAVLVNFWASWCGPCRAEMPAMQRIYEEYEEQGFTILAVNVTSQDSRSAASAFVTQYGLTFPILMDETGAVSRAYHLNAFPSSYFIDRNGIIQEVVLGGPMSEALLRIRIESLLEVK